MVRSHGLTVPLERWHEQEPASAIGLWSAALDRWIHEDIDPLYAVVRALPWARALPEGSAIQHPPRVRFRPPGSRGAEFHTDAWAGNPADQLILWIPLVDTIAEESLWLVPPEDTSVLDRQPFAEAQRHMYGAATPCPLSVGEVLLMDATTGHGAPRHDRARTRVSVDIRLSQSTPGTYGWSHRDARVAWGG